MTKTLMPGGEPLIRILHPSDFSQGSNLAFAHALKIALQSRAELEIVHVESHKIGAVDDVPVMATQGHCDFLVALRGSITERVLRATRCPLLAVPASS